MENLYFKAKTSFEKGKTYSVCLRGARRFPTSNEYDLYLYDQEGNLLGLAQIISQQHFCFNDLKEKHCTDNYDDSARSPGSLYNAMILVYTDFEIAEIVTILRFEIV